MVVVNRFLKISHFIPCNKSNDASHIDDLYFKKIVRLHSIPRTIVFDQDSKFLIHFWRIIYRKLGTSLSFSSSHHPQIDRQIEVTKKSLGNLLGSYVGKNIKQWDLILPQIQFAYNHSMHHSIGKSPFKVIYDANPIGPLDLVPHSTTKQFHKDADERAK